MKKKYYIKILGMLTSVALLSGCSKIPEVIQEEALQNKTTTRVLASTDYYWYNGQQFPLTKYTYKRYIIFQAIQTSSLETKLKSKGITLSLINTNKYTRPIVNKIITSKLINLVTEDLKWAVVEGVNSAIHLDDISEIVYEAPFYKSSSGQEVGLSNLFYVKLKSADDITKLNELALINNVEVVGNNIFMPLWFTLSCSVKSSGNGLEMANLFYETNLFENTEADFMMDKILNVNDTYFNTQWGLRNTMTAGVDINYLNARTVTMGESSVIIAVLDHGIQLEHPDFSNFASKSYDTHTNTSPSVVRGDHGTACAGIIGATTNNNLGVAGVASGAKLMSLSNNLMIGSDDKQSLANGIYWAAQNGASVISNSWGHEMLQSPLIEDAIKYALTYGRNGKGCVIVFASGNDYSGTVGYPARSIPDIIAVGAIDQSGSRSSFSNYGTALDIVAPGRSITTTDRTGSEGYSSEDYTFNFSGTSAACPHVAGVAGLIISINPTLTQKQVTDIIEKTARKVGSYTYTTTLSRPNGTWYRETGYGLVDSYAAVMAASGDCATVNVQNTAYSTTTNIQACYINVSNVTINNGALLTLKGTKSVNVNYPFTVNSGSRIAITN